MAATAAKAARRCARPSAETPCFTSLGVATGSAFAARILLPAPLTGPYHAVLASTAKKNARRQRPKVSGTRRNDGEMANGPDIGAVYHVAPINMSFALAPTAGTGNPHAEVTRPRWLQQLFGGVRNFHSASSWIPSLEILRGVESSTGTQCRQQQFRRCHADRSAAMVCRLMAHDSAAVCA